MDGWMNDGWTDRWRDGGLEILVHSKYTNIHTVIVEILFTAHI